MDQDRVMAACVTFVACIDFYFCQFYVVQAVGRALANHRFYAFTEKRKVIESSATAMTVRSRPNDANLRSMWLE
jgi:hypothetical protein